MSNWQRAWLCSLWQCEGGTTDVARAPQPGRRLDPTTGNIYHLKFKPPPPHIFGRLVIRPDDQPEKQRHRIGIYNDTKRDLVAAFAAIVVPVNAEQPIPAVYEEFKRKVPLDTPPKAKL